jgi:RHS repeat-associated protein
MRGRARRAAARHRLLAAAVAVVVPATLLSAVPGAAAAPKPQWPWDKPQPATASVPVTRALARAARPSAVLAHPWQLPAVHWPSGGTGVTAVPEAGGAAVTASVLDRATTERAGITGLLLRVTPAAQRSAAAHKTAAAQESAASLTVDYSGFRYAYGGDWAARLRLVQLPACAATTPELARCRQRVPVASRNDVTAGRLVAPRVSASAASVFAVDAAPAGSTGDYRATSLAPASSWQVSQQTGSFAWSYPMRVPPVPGGLQPSPSLAYSSGSVDGRLATTNNQTSWVGDGFDLSPGFIERRYKPCADDGVTPKTGDLCWGGDYVSVSLGSHSADLIHDAGGEWRLREDDGTRVEHVTGAANGDNDGEYWKLTTTDGTQYFFGQNRITPTSPATDSAWTVPVFGNNDGEPCHQATFATSWCQQAYRWNLDRVVDPHGNVVMHYYQAETNFYGRDLTAANFTQYTRGGVLLHSDYGLRAGAESATPLAQVVYETAERCLPTATVDCAESKLSKTTAGNWPDVPFDQICGAASCSNFSPTFFTRKRLIRVTTKVGGTAVDKWEFGHTYPASGDGLSPSLWLHTITHTGLVGGSLAVPAVTLDGQTLANRVDGLEGLPAMIRWRLSSIKTESGAEISVTYSPTECTRATLPAPQSNTMRCFPQFWTPDGAATPVQDWFHKYVVKQVQQIDRTGQAPDEITRYDYQGAAWHYDEDELTPAARRGWSQWRGYARVLITHGETPAQQSQTEHLYFRGMDGDKLPSGTRSVTVTDSEGTQVRDAPRLAGYERESIVHNGPDGAEVSGQIQDPWLSAPTATQGARQAGRLGTAAVRARVALAAGGFRRTETRTTFDAFGMPETVSELGDTTTTDDDQCVRYTYARNTAPAVWLISPVGRTETLSVSCADAATPSRPADVVSDERTYFDGATAFGTAPTKGEVTRTEELSAWVAGAPVYTTTGQQSYDGYGRVRTSTDAAGNLTKTDYTPATGTATQVAITNPLLQVTTTTNQPAWGSPLSTVDANGKRTDLAYDALGRLTQVWLPGRAKATQSASLRFGYLVRKDGVVAVSTQTLRNDGTTYTTSYALLDSLLRPRQTQSPAPGGGRVVSDTVYNSLGQVGQTNHAYFNSAAPGTDLVLVADNVVQSQDVLSYDGAERPTVDVFRSLGGEQWRTTTSYGGDRVSVRPPPGGTALTTISDALGRTTELRQYHGGEPTGAYDATRYGYEPGGQLAAVTDPAGNAWHYHYDLRGRRDRADDPDTGTSTTTYDDLDQVTTSTDSRGRTLAYSYDALGRRTGVYQGSTSGTRLAGWTYDTLAKGQLTAATRYDGGNAYVTAVTGYDDRYRATGSTVTIPPGETDLAGTYTSSVTYNLDGTRATESLPAVGGVPAETLTYGYDELGDLTTLTTPDTTYVNTTIWGKLGTIQQRRFGIDGKRVVRAYTYQDSTNRLVRAVTDVEQETTSHQADQAYDYDAAGNVLSVKDTPQTDVSAPDAQCYRYDYLRRLTEAWTPGGGDCEPDPSVALLGGPAPYWQSYGYDLTGNRTSSVAHAAAGDTTRAYAYPAAGSAQPHTVRSVGESGPAGSRTTAYGYDSDGNTTTRPATTGTGGQVLDWNDEGQLATVTQGADLTTYLYDADGGRLIRRDPTSVTLYLGGTELKVDKRSHIARGTRYYDDGTGTIAVRTFDGRLSWQVSDPHGTGELSVDASTMAVTRRRTTPFGEVRDGPATLRGEHGFVGGPVDASTGLTHLGAREYDPALGRFLSADPVVDPTDPQQLNGYAYASDSPVTNSDATGLLVNCGADGFRCGMAPGYDQSGHYGGAPAPPAAAPRSSPAPKRRPWSQQPDGGGYAPHHAYTPRKARHWSQQPDGDYEYDNFVPDWDFLERQAHPPEPEKRHSRWRTFAHIVGEVSGYNDARDCIMHGDVGACVNTALNVMPMGRGLSMAGKAARLGGHLAEDAHDVAKVCRLHSFDPATRVLMANGRTKAIADVRIGDLVRATDPGTGLTTVHRVVALHNNLDDDISDVVIAVAHGRAMLRTTQHHPFWSLARHGWVAAAALEPGERVATATRAVAIVVGVHSYTATHDMRDLTVADVHSYYVLAGITPILVHNCGEGLAELADLSIGKTNVAAEVTNGSGQVGRGVSRARSAGELTPQVRVAAEATGHHMGCAEIGGLCDLELKQAPLTGLSSEAVKVAGGSKGYTYEQHLGSEPMCSACTRLFDYLNGT